MRWCLRCMARAPTGVRCPACGEPLLDLGLDQGVATGSALFRDDRNTQVQEPSRAGGPWEGTAIRTSLGGPRANLRASPPPRRRRLGRPGDPAAPDADYQLLEHLGHGGMGEVHAARQIALGRTVAIKRLAASGLSSEARHRFRAEAVIASGLDHPNIIPVYDLGEDEDGHPFFAMKLVQGRVWGSCLAELGETRNLEILIQVCDGIAYAHANGVIHGDLKPDNVMLGEFGEVLVMDWGLAARLEDIHRRDPADRLVCGTPAYLAPEMARADHAAIGPASDLYLLGACLYEILTGDAPHNGDTIRACLDNAIANQLHLPLPEGELAATARRALATRPEDRHPDVRTFQQELRAHLGHAESHRLSRQADLTLAKAKGSGRHETYGRAIAGHEQALILWPENPQALTGLQKARSAFAWHALGTGDLELANSLVAGLRTARPEDAAAIDARILEAHRARRAAQIRLRLLSATALAATVLVVVVTATAAVIAGNERQAVIAAIRQRDEAELRLAALGGRTWDTVIAENFNGDRIAPAVQPLQGDWRLEDRMLLARGPGDCLAAIATSGHGPLRLAFDLEHGSSVEILLGAPPAGLPAPDDPHGLTISLGEEHCAVRRGSSVLAQAALPRTVRSLARHIAIDAREGTLAVIVDGRHAFAQLHDLERHESDEARLLLRAQPGARLDNLRVDRFAPLMPEDQPFEWPPG